MSTASRIDTAPAPSSEERANDILSAEALDFIAELHGRFEPTRQELLAARRERDQELRNGGTLDFLEETKEIREGDWSVPVPFEDYQDRRVEITGPTDRKLTYDASDGKHYELADETATLLLRPRGWHLNDKHVKVEGTEVSGGLLDFGLYFFHNAQRLLDAGSHPYFYFPKMEHHLEARLWNDVLTFAEDAMGVPHGSARATVLIETLPAAFQMDEILFELRDHSYGLNAGRWDYIFSMIKCF